MGQRTRGSERCREKDRNVWTEDKEERVLKRETKRYNGEEEDRRKGEGKRGCRERSGII